MVEGVGRGCETMTPSGGSSKREHAPGMLSFDDGAQGRDRTTDTVIFSHVLYQLSYLGIA